VARKALIAPQEIKALGKLASQAAAGYGDRRPGVAVVYVTSRQTANIAAASERVDSDQATYLVVLQGHFIGPMPFAPRPRMRATGHVITLVIDSTTNQMTDFGVGNHEPDVARLSRPVPLHLP
jgi:hypothetical protein